MSKTEAYALASEHAVAALSGVDLPARLSQLGLPMAHNGRVELRFFGIDACLRLPDLRLYEAATMAPLRPADRILLLHYLLHPAPVAFADRVLAFRDFPGGAFYLAPFRLRTTVVLLDRFGNDLDLLRSRLARFDTVSVPLGDLGARVHAFGPLHVTLVYSRGDEELGPSAELLFDAAVRTVFAAEDAAVLASRICLGLL
jgi:hypothetical protein